VRYVIYITQPLRRTSGTVSPSHQGHGCPSQELWACHPIETQRSAERHAAVTLRSPNQSYLPFRIRESCDCGPTTRQRSIKHQVLIGVAVQMHAHLSTEVLNFDGAALKRHCKAALELILCSVEFIWWNSPIQQERKLMHEVGENGSSSRWCECCKQPE
jgi:hypothetical protein